MMVMLPIAAFVALLNFVSKHWKIPALVLFCLVGFGGGFLLVQKHLDESDRRAQELYAEKLQECITAQIPLPTCNRPLKKWASNASGTLFSKKRVSQTRLRSDCTGQSGLFAGHLAHFGRTYPRAHA